MKKELILGCDFLALDLMKEVIRFLEESDVAYTFVGVESLDDKKNYPLIAADVSKRIVASNYKKEGILICGTGLGMSITANKFPGIHAALVTNIYAAERSRLSNNANVLCLGALTTTATLAKLYISEWLNLEYIVGRSEPKLALIRKFEEENFQSILK